MFMTTCYHQTILYVYEFKVYIYETLCDRAFQIRIDKKKFLRLFPKTNLFSIRQFLSSVPN